MLRVSFSSVTKARAAVEAFAAYGYAAERLGCDVVTDCPPLLAIPEVQKRVGFAAVERLDLNGRIDSLAPADDLGEATAMASAAPAGELRA
jgi:hypothetical protein